MTEVPLNIDGIVASYANKRPDMWVVSACGITSAGTPIPVLLHRDSYVTNSDQIRVLLLGGLSGYTDEVELIVQALKLILETDNIATKGLAISAIPCANIDGFTTTKAPLNSKGGNLLTGYPPSNAFFYHPVNSELRYIWRWICFLAPDLILELVSGQVISWEANLTAAKQFSHLKCKDITGDSSLIGTLGTENQTDFHTIPGLRLTIPRNSLPQQLSQIWDSLTKNPSPSPSSARLNLLSLGSRSPKKIASLLARYYGHKFDSPVMYTQGIGISGRLRLWARDKTISNPIPDIIHMTSPFLSGNLTLFETNAETHNLGAVLWADELAEVTNNSAHSKLLLHSAQHITQRGHGEPPHPADPDFRTEDLFLLGTILGRAYRLTNDPIYIEIAIDMFLHHETQQANGLYWHSRSNPYYWGRGNGFAALGLAELLTYMPRNHLHRQRIIEMHVKLLDGLIPTQEPSGMFPQLLNYRGSYHEHSATSMIGYSVAKGILLGWLEYSQYIKLLDAAWKGVIERIDHHGKLVDVCTSTGVYDDDSGYLNRPAISGYDDRGGGMALWFAIEMCKLYET